MQTNYSGKRRPLTRLLAPALVVATTLLSSVAFAGKLQVKDEESLLSSADRSALETAVGNYPFDVRVLTTETHASDFDRYVGEQVSEADQIVVGIDKTHRHTSVHFGKGAGIAKTEFHAIEQAGNAGFRSGDFKAGIQAILDRAQQAVGTSAMAAPSQSQSGSPMAPAQPASNSGGFPFGWLILGGLILVGFLAVRRFMSGGTRTMYPPTGPQPPGYGPGQGYGPGYGQGYGPGYGRGGGSGIGTGIIGAGLGGLAGYELGKAMGEREQRSNEGGVFGGGGSSDDNSGGGGDSSWDAGGDSGGWDDSGGGGGGDWGGGGDSGGGDGSW